MLEVLSVRVTPVKHNGRILRFWGSVTLGIDGQPLMHVSSWIIERDGRIIDPSRATMSGWHVAVFQCAGSEQGERLSRSIRAALRAKVMGVMKGGDEQ